MDKQSLTSAVEFVAATVERLRPLSVAAALAEWEAAVNSTPTTMERYRQMRAELMHFWADPQRYALAQKWDAELSSDHAADPLLARQIRLIYLMAAQQQQEAETIEQVAALEAQVRSE